MTLENCCIREKIKGKSLIINGFNIQFYRSISEFTPPPYFDYFLEKKYFEALEKVPPRDFTYCYLVFEHIKTGDIVGFIACEVKVFDAGQSLNYDVTNANVFKKIKISIQKAIAKQTRFSTLIIGNLTLSGEHSFWFDDEKLDFNVKKHLFTEGVNFMKTQLKQHYNTKISAVFLKDFFQNSPNYALMTALKDVRFNEFQVEPNFIFTVKKEWKTFDDYMESLSSKYRVRAKKAFKNLGNNVERKEFFEERILANYREINDLYKTISSNAKFNLTDLHDDYFLEMKQTLGDNFHMSGYFLDGKLIGFFTTINNHGRELDAHFLGYDATVNHSHQIYLNILFDIIKQGIEGQYDRIIFGRTAHEIKSSVGAEAVEMSLFIRHENRLINRILPYVLRILKPRDMWVARTPFK